MKAFLQRLRAAFAYSAGRPEWPAVVIVGYVLNALIFAVLAWGTSHTGFRMAWLAVVAASFGLLARYVVQQRRRGPHGSIMVRGRDLREVNAFLRSCGLEVPLKPGTHYVSTAIVAHPTGYMVVDVKHRQVA